jgi:rod shape-determining protein MreC
MPLGTLDRTPPPFFKQGPSALSKLLVFSALAVFLMVADLRFQITQPVRSVLGLVVLPVQWLAMQPAEALRWTGRYFESLASAQRGQEQAQVQLALQAARGLQVEQLAQENQQLRELLELRTRITTTGQAAEVAYEAADPYTRKVVIDKGQMHRIEVGSPVIDAAGVIGQVTRVHPLVSEVTLITDRDQAIPVLNARTGQRSVAHGDPSAPHPGGLELRFMAANADVKLGDLLTTSGVDGVYPAGLPVAQIIQVERRTDSAFARIQTRPVAGVSRARHVLVLQPIGAQLPPRPPAEAVSPPRKGGRK